MPKMSAPNENGLGIPEHGSPLDPGAVDQTPTAQTSLSDEQLDRLNRLEEQNKKLEAERERMARESYRYQTQPPVAPPAAPGPAPDPVGDPDGFREWTNSLSQFTQAAQNQTRYEVDERQRRDQIWRDFKAEYPLESRSERLVQAAFLEETGNGGAIPGDEETLKSMKESVARRVRGYAEAITGSDVAPTKEADRTEGISSGSTATPAPPPKAGGEKVSSLIDALFDNQPAGFF